MAYGKIFADGIETSTGSEVNLTQVVSTDATTSTSGYMSAADKTKLDGLQTLEPITGYAEVDFVFNAASDTVQVSDTYLTFAIVTGSAATTGLASVVSGDSIEVTWATGVETFSGVSAPLTEVLPNYDLQAFTYTGRTVGVNKLSEPASAKRIKVSEGIVGDYSTFSGDYDDLTNKPAASTVVLENATFVGGISTVASESRVVTTANVTTSGSRSVGYAPWSHPSADETTWTDNGSGTLTIEITSGSGDNFWLNNFNDSLSSDMNMFVISWPTAGETWYYASDMKSQLESMNVNASTQYRTLTYTESEIYPTSNQGDQVKTSDATVTETALGGDLRGGASSFVRFARAIVTNTTTVQTIVGSGPWDGNRDVTINETDLTVLQNTPAGDLFSVSGNTGTRTQESFSGEVFVDCEAGDVLSQALAIVFENNGNSYTLLANAT